MSTQALPSMPAATPRLPSSALSDVVNEYFLTTDLKPWNRFTTFEWDKIDASKLTAGQRSAVSFVTYIEDHLPGYFAAYHHIFPLREDVELDEFIHNREVYRFAVRWAQEEDAHAHVLQTYQLRAGLAEPDQLRRDLAVEGRKDFALLRQFQPVQFFTYTLVQEKATQLYYQKLSQVVDEPVLKQILQYLTRDESRHFAFFARVIEAYIREFGDIVLPLLKDTLVQFKMPLATTLKNYWRWSINISEVADNYNYLEAYEHLILAIKRAADAPTWSKSQDLRDFVGAVCRA
jgi:acyl-[acyl-carrier-protein] desaturase